MNIIFRRKILADVKTRQEIPLPRFILVLLIAR
jgi:hypothetical protein